MGLNFYTVCHPCRVRVYVSRGDEHYVLHRFYREHAACRKIDPNACEVQGDGESEQDWMNDDSYEELYGTKAATGPVSAERERVMREWRAFSEGSQP